MPDYPIDFLDNQREKKGEYPANFLDGAFSREEPVEEESLLSSFIGSPFEPKGILGAPLMAIQAIDRGSDYLSDLYDRASNAPSPSFSPSGSIPNYLAHQVATSTPVRMADYALRDVEERWKEQPYSLSANEAVQGALPFVPGGLAGKALASPVLNSIAEVIAGWEDPRYKKRPEEIASSAGSNLGMFGMGAGARGVTTLTKKSFPKAFKTITRKDVLSEAVKADPNTRKFLLAAEKSGLLPDNVTADSILEKGRYSKATKAGLERFNAMVNDPNTFLVGTLTKDVPGQAGAAIASEVRKRAPEIRKSGILEETAKKLDKGATNYPETLREVSYGRKAKASKKIEKLKEALVEAETKGQALGKSTSIKMDNIAEDLRDLTKQQTKFQSLGETKSRAEGALGSLEEGSLLIGKSLELLEDGTALPLHRAIEIHQEITQARQLMNEFNTAAIAGRATGVTAGESALRKGRLDTLTSLQKKLETRIEAGIKQAKKDKLLGRGKSYTKLNKEFSAAATTENAATALLAEQDWSARTFGKTSIEETYSANRRGNTLLPTEPSQVPFDALSLKNLAGSVGRTAASFRPDQVPASVLRAGGAFGPETQNALRSFLAGNELRAGGIGVPEQTSVLRAPFAIGEMLSPEPGRVPQLFNYTNSVPPQPEEREALPQPGILGGSGAPTLSTSEPLPRDTNFIVSNPEAVLGRAAELGAPQAMLEDIEQAMSSSNRVMVDEAFAALAQAVPGLFEDAPYQSQLNGKIYDAKERELRENELMQLRKSGQLSKHEWARSVSALNGSGSIEAINQSSGGGYSPSFKNQPNMTPVGGYRTYSY